MSDTSVTERKGRVGEPRAEKIAVVDEVQAKLAAATAAILTEYRGLKVADLEALRRSLRAAGGEYKIYKNTLVRFATRELGIEGIDVFLEGPTAIAFADADVPGVAKALRDFSRTNPLLVVKGGVMGTSILSAGDAAALAEIPPREVLLARLAGLIAAPLQQFAGLLQALPRNFAYGLQALIDQRGGVPEAPAEAAAPAAEAAAPVEATADAPVEAAAPVEATADAPVEAPAPAEATADAPVEAPALAEAPAADAPVAEAPAAEAAVTADAAPEPAAPEAVAPETTTDPSPAAPSAEPTEGAE